MPLSEERYTAIQEMLAAIEPGMKHLTDWQKSFIGDQMNRIHQYGQETLMSDKQMTQIRKAYKDVTGSEYGEEEPPPAEPPRDGPRRGRGSYDEDDEIPF